MNEAAKAVMKELPDLVIAYGNSDEYRYADTQRIFFHITDQFSFVFHKDCTLFERRAR